MEKGNLIDKDTLIQKDYLTDIASDTIPAKDTVTDTGPLINQGAAAIRGPWISRRGVWPGYQGTLIGVPRWMRKP